MQPLTSEHFESLDLDISQPKNGHRYGAESLALADFILAQKGNRVAELGAGSGVISLIIAKRDQPALVVAIEIQKEMHDIAFLNTRQNGLQNIVKCINKDWRKFSISNQSSFDLVVANPPFYAAGSGRISENESRAKARHEINGTITDLVSAASRLLVPNGRFAVVFNSSRKKEFLQTAKDSELVVLSVKDDISSDFFLAELRKGHFY